MRKKKGPIKKRARHDTSSKAKKTYKRRSRKTKVPKTRNGGTLTEAQYWQKIRHSLRKAFRWWKPMMDALKSASRPSQSSNKRLKIEYQCSECKGWFPRTQVEIDHKIPCGSLNGYDDLAQFVKNLTPEDPKAFQILCKPDHKKKTEAEKEQRANIKKLNI